MKNELFGKKMLFFVKKHGVLQLTRSIFLLKMIC